MSSCAEPETGRVEADLMLRGGRVVTVAENLPEAEALAVRGYEIVAVGTDDEIAPWIGAQTEVVELAGRLAIPGFVEGHGHFLGLGDALTILDLSGAASWNEIVAQVAEAAASAAPGEWIRGRGWHQEKWTGPPTPAVEGAPVHASLSAVSAENPVLLTHASGHAAFANAKALALAGLDRDSPDPPGGELVRGADGELTGLLRETAQRAVGAAYAGSRADRGPEERAAELRRLVRLAGEEALRKGVTSFQDAGSSLDTIDALRRLAEQGELPVRLYVMVRDGVNSGSEHVPGVATPQDGWQAFADRLRAARTVPGGNDFLAVRSIKRQIDGALGAHGAWLLEPYADLPRSAGLNLEDPDDIRRMARLAVELEFQVNTHAIGDRANREILDIYEEAFAAAGNATDLRWRIEHAQHLHPDDVPRFAQLGVVASIQGVHCTSDGPWVAKRLGEERARSGAYVWRSLLDAGAVVSNGTDVPVEDIDPIASFYATVSRRTNTGETFFAGQRMSREEALHSYTLAGAFAAFEDHLKGSLEPGKLADVVVLDRDILSVPESEIPETLVDLTIVGGEVRYRREGS
jgi:predicted amidohydrolase YtcJ